MLFYIDWIVNSSSVWCTCTNKDMH